MKNIDKKTMVFYTYQLNTQNQYNVSVLQPDIKEPKIKDVITSLPIDLNKGNYHFRFKSQFFQGQEKTVGWIDISNLMAKVPFYNNAIYVKILSLANPQSKAFSHSKLAKAGLINNYSEQKLPLNNSNRSPIISQPIQTINRRPSNLPSSPIIPIKKNIQPPKNIVNDPINLFTFPENPIVKCPPPPSTPAQNLQVYQEAFRREAEAMENQAVARDQMEEIINKWGYSGTKIVNNLTTLLATLDQIWPSWQKVSLGDMLREEDVYKIYKKAVIKLHPDKTRHLDFRKKYLSKRVFELLNEAKKKQ